MEKYGRTTKVVEAIMKTKLTITGEDFYINDKKVYSELENEKVHGLLMNARFIQGIFDDKAEIERYNRYGKVFDQDRNTDELIEALPEWYAKGLRAFTVGLQGGGPCFTINNSTIHNNPFLENGMKLDEAYAIRLKRLIEAADEIGMVVIVSFFYPGQAVRFTSGAEILNSVRTACDFLMANEFDNIIIEICNEYDLVKNTPDNWNW